MKMLFNECETNVRTLEKADYFKYRDRKWQQMEESKEMWYRELMYGIKHGKR